MAMKPVCEVYETARDVRKYRVKLIDVTDADAVMRIDKEIDLCPRALERLVAKITGGITPPIAKPRKPKAVPSE